MIRLPFSSVISFPYFRPFAAAFVSGAEEYSIMLSGEEDVFTDCPISAKAGDTVIVHTVDVADGEVKITVNGEDAGSWQDWGTYTFVMPDQDVELYGWISTEGFAGA